MESPDALGADWSPRISFSYGFASKPRIASPACSPAHDSEFEFSSFPAADLTPKLHMLSAEELFHDGKLRVVDESSEAGMSENEGGENGSSTGSRDNVGAIRSRGVREVYYAFEEKLPTIRAREAGGPRVEAMAKERAGRQADGRQIEVARAPTSRGEMFRPSCTQERERLPKSRGNVASVQSQDVVENTGECRLPTSSEDEAPLEKSKRRAPTVGEDAVGLQNSVTSRRKGQLRSTASRNELLRARGSLGNGNAEMEMRLSDPGQPTSRKQSRVTSISDVNKCDELRTPVQWREVASAPKKNKENERSSSVPWRRSSRNPRSASMTVDDFSQFAHRSCVSLENSRCPSPTRSFSLPATTPTSPTASCSSAFSASKRRHTSRFKDFFRLRRLTFKDAEPSSLSARMPLSTRFFFPFLKTKEARANISDVAPPLTQHAPEQPGLSMRYTFHDPAMKQQRIAATGKCQFGTLHGDSDNAQVAKPPSEQAAVENSRPLSVLGSISDKSAQNGVDPAVGSRTRGIRLSYSMDQGTSLMWSKGVQQAAIGRDEIVWIAGNNTSSYGDGLPSEISAKEGNQKCKSGGLMGSAGGGIARHHSKSLERPIPYTSSVRVTPVLNVPSCITPALRKAKSSSNLKPFNLERILLRRGKEQEGQTRTPPTNERM